MSSDQGRLPLETALLDRTADREGFDVDARAGEVDQVGAAELDHAEPAVGAGGDESLLGEPGQRFADHREAHVEACAQGGEAQLRARLQTTGEQIGTQGLVHACRPRACSSRHAGQPSPRQPNSARDIANPTIVDDESPATAHSADASSVSSVIPACRVGSSTVRAASAEQLPGDGQLHHLGRSLGDLRDARGEVGLRQPGLLHQPEPAVDLAGTPRPSGERHRPGHRWPRLRHRARNGAGRRRSARRPRAGHRSARSGLIRIIQ